MRNSNIADINIGNLNFLWGMSMKVYC